MAYKDEYEVARLYTDGRFTKALADQFASHERIEFHLAPPLLGQKDAQGNPIKSVFPQTMLWGFRFLSAVRFLRGTPLDLFGYTDERRLERKMIRDYQTMIDQVLARLDAAHHAQAVEIAALPMQVRGFGHVKLRNYEAMIQKRDQLLAVYFGQAEAGASVAQAAE